MSSCVHTLREVVHRQRLNKNKSSVDVTNFLMTILSILPRDLWSVFIANHAKCIKF